MKLLVIVIFVATMFGCASSNNSDDLSLLELVDKNKVKWDLSGVENYLFTYSRTPSDCPTIDAFPPVVITVESKVITSVYVPDLNSFESSLSSWPTISKIFELMVVDINSSPNVIAKNNLELDSAPDFNSQFGYPVSYYFDKSSQDCDAYLIKVAEFQ